MLSRYLKMAAVALLLTSGVAHAHGWGDGGGRRHYLHQLREACDEGDRHACVRFGIEIGERRERREAWRQNRPDYYGEQYRGTQGDWR